MMDEADPIDALVDAFPRLFHSRPPAVHSSLPPGWSRLVYALFVDLDSLLTDAEAETFKVVQIKEKFGGLRVYFKRDMEETLTADLIGGGPHGTRRISVNPKNASRTFKLIRARVDQAEAESFSTCKQCGVGGASTANLGGWVTTLCDECRAPRLKAWKQAYDERLDR